MRPYLALIAIVPLALAAAATSSVAAGSPGNERVYADSFGNLIIDSAVGYKRILVGEGRSARKLANFTGSRPRVIYLDGQDQSTSGNCYQPPMLIRGRSYMYGFFEGEIPQIGLRCP